MQYCTILPPSTVLSHFLIWTLNNVLRIRSGHYLELPFHTLVIGLGKGLSLGRACRREDLMQKVCCRNRSFFVYSTSKMADEATDLPDGHWLNFSGSTVTLWLSNGHKPSVGCLVSVWSSHVLQVYKWVSARGFIFPIFQQHAGPLCLLTFFPVHTGIL